MRDYKVPQRDGGFLPGKEESRLLTGLERLQRNRIPPNRYFNVALPLARLRARRPRDPRGMSIIPSLTLLVVLWQRLRLDTGDSTAWPSRRRNTASEKLCSSPPKAKIKIVPRTGRCPGRLPTEGGRTGVLERWRGGETGRWGLWHK